MASSSSCSQQRSARKGGVRGAFTLPDLPIRNSRRALAVVLFACAGPDDLRIALEDRERPERVVGLVREDVLPGDALVGGLPDAARGGAYIKDGGIPGVDLEVVDAAARGRGADPTKVERIERGAHGLCLRASGRERDEYDKCDE